jgi:tRNA (adenine57-N1/adenine58-N1)-methyltransferase
MGHADGGADAPRSWPPLAAGELVVLIDHKQRRHFVRLRPHAEAIDGLRHDEVIGQPDGCLLRDRRGRPVWCFRARLEDAVRALPRRTQILYPKDLATILMRADIRPGAAVLEAGLGSGALAAVLLRFLSPGGRLVSYEVREEFARLAERNLAELGLRDGPAAAEHRIELRDVYQGIGERDLDAVILDVPAPERCLAHAAAALRPGGSLLAWLPTALQVHRVGNALQATAWFADLAIDETLQRPWHVGPASVRPVHRMVAHTGFLVSARRTAVAVAAAPVHEEPARQGEDAPS